MTSVVMRVFCLNLRQRSTANPYDLSPTPPLKREGKYFSASPFPYPNRLPLVTLSPRERAGVRWGKGMGDRGYLTFFCSSARSGLFFARACASAHFAFRSPSTPSSPLPFR